MRSSDLSDDGWQRSSRASETGLASAPTLGLYEAIHSRRDVRGEFNGQEVDPSALRRVLGAAHAAPSVGLTQPWDFIVVGNLETKQLFWEHVQTERRLFASTLDSQSAERFAGIRIDGIMESTLSIVVTYDPTRGAPAVLGRHAIADAGLYSVCLAIENLWLAATAESWGVGWVSFYREPFLSELLNLPPDLRPVAWLCVGPVSHLETVPDLERKGWRSRRPLEEAVHYDSWQYERTADLPTSGSAPGSTAS